VHKLHSGIIILCYNLHNGYACSEMEIEKKKGVDWESIKQEYLLSEIMSVTDFFAQKYPNISYSWVNKSTVGWRHQKREMQAAVLKKKRVSEKKQKQYEQLAKQAETETKSLTEIRDKEIKSRLIWNAEKIAKLKNDMISHINNIFAEEKTRAKMTMSDLRIMHGILSEELKSGYVVDNSNVLESIEAQVPQIVLAAMNKL